MVNKDNIQEQILKDILLKMNYDSSKTLNENIQEQQQYNIPNRTMQSDNTRVDPQYLGLMPDGKPIPPGLMLNYIGKNKPSPPSHQDIVYSSNMSSYDKKVMMNKLDYSVTYTSPRLKRLCKDNKICSCSQYKTSCKGIKGKGLLMKVYKLDLENWEANQTSPPLPDDFWHWVLPIGAVIVTLATGGVGGLVIAGVLEAADIALYVKEKDYESAGIGAAFAVIPGGMLLNKIPFVKKFTSGALKTFLSKVSKGLDLSPMERKLSTELEKNADWIAKNVQAYAKLSSLTSKLLSKYTGKKLIRVLLHLSKLGLYPWRATWRVAALGGGLLTFMQIGKILGVQIKGLDYRRVELPEEYVKLSEEDKEIFQKDLLNQVVNESTEIQESAKKSVAKVIETIDEEKVEYINTELSRLDSVLENL
jgi:hypothetical protein